MAKYIVQHRRGTATQWAAHDTVIPMAGEIVIEIDEENSLHKLKIGDGVHTYAELAYLMAGDDIVTQVLAKALPRVVTVTLNVDQWTEVTCETDPNLGYYGQTITLDGITEYSRLDLQPDADMIAEFKQVGIGFVAENKGGIITVYSTGNMPSKTYTIQATIIETELEVDSDKVVGIPVGVPPLNAGGRGVGEKTPEGGEIFNTYEDETINEETIAKNKALTHSHAEGESNIAGTKAFEVTGIDIDNKAITLDSVEGLSINDEYSIHVSTSVEFAGKITEINTETRTVTVDKLSTSLVLGDNYSNHWFWIPAKPTLGTHIIGRGTHAEGGNNIAGHLYSHAEGCDNIAGGRYSHAEGRGNKVAYAGHAEGRFNAATGLESHAEGRKTVSKSPSAHTEGTYTVARSSSAHAEGLGIYSSNDFIDVNGDIQGKATNENYGAHGVASHSEGVHTFAKGLGAHAEGIGRDKQSDSNAPDDSEPENIGAIGNGSHSEGYKTYASGNYSHAEGNQTKAKGQSSHSEGINTEASALAAHAEGQNTKAYNTAAHSEGSTTDASGVNSHAEGLHTIASGSDSHAEGHGQNNSKVEASGLGSHAEGIRTKSQGSGSHSEGADTQASGGRSHAEGNSTYAPGFAAHAEGSGRSQNQGSTQDTYGAFGNYSHSEGNQTTAEGQSSHSEGELTKAVGTYSHSEGNQTKAIGKASHAEGYQTIAQNDYSYAGGMFNKINKKIYETIDLNDGTSNTKAGVTINNKQVIWDLSDTDLTTMRHFAFNRMFEGTITLELRFKTETNYNYTIFALNSLDYVTTQGGKTQKASGVLIANKDYTIITHTITVSEDQPYLDIMVASEKVADEIVTMNFAGIVISEEIDTDIIHVIGNGTSDTNRSNAFAVFKDGHAEVQIVGDTDNSVVTKKYVDQQIGDIEATLDAIIAIQNELIGGNS